MSRMFLVAGSLLLILSYTEGSCEVDKDVKFILANMNPTNVKKEVDCVVDLGDCDNLGRKLKAEAPRAVREGKCGKNCPCDEIQIRLVVNKLKREHPAEWQRVVDKYSN